MDKTQTFKHLLSPINIGPIQIKNRVVFLPCGSNMAQPVWTDGEFSILPSERDVYYYEERAKGEVGLIIVEASVVHPSSDQNPINPIFLYDERCIEPLKHLVETVHKYGTKIFIQLWHAGHQANNNIRTMRPMVSASQIPPVKGFQGVKELEKEEIEEIIDGYGKSARNAREAGFDGVELHTHYSLPAQFMSPFFNKRTDEYGGSFENRMRFVLEVINAMRENIGNDRAVGLTLNADESIPGGLSADDMCKVAQTIEATGKVDFLEVKIGSKHNHAWVMAPLGSGIPPGHLAEPIARIKESLKEKKILILGNPILLTPYMGERLLEEGKMDMVGTGRGLIADPEIVKKISENRINDIIPCISCLQYCVGRDYQGVHLSCVLNPATGREKQWGLGTLTQAEKKKSILVIGGGLAGLEAARVAGLRGHHVSLYEKEKVLGGQIQLSLKLPSRGMLMAAVKWYERQLKKHGVKVVTGVKVDLKIVDELNPDSIIVATGSSFVRTGLSGFIAFPIPGWDQNNVHIPEDILRGEVNTGNNIIILDDVGTDVAIGVAYLLASQGKRVEIITRYPLLAPALYGPTGRYGFEYSRIAKLNVKCTINTYIKEISGNTVYAFNLFTKEEVVREDVDDIVIITSKQSHTDLYKQIKAKGKPEVFVIGDCAAPRGYGEAVYDGHKVGREI